MIGEMAESSTAISGKANERIINDFTITFCTINGSGSATANTTILRALFKMGIPVSGKNVFPSNIQGLPTWYSIRVNKNGFIARADETQIVVAMNPSSFNEDLARLVPGGAFFYADDIRTPIYRNDVVLYPMPVKQISRDADVPKNLRDYIANMVYVGVVAQIIGIDLQQIYDALDVHFKGKTKPIESNYTVVKTAAEWAQANLTKTDPYWIESMGGNDGLIMSDGNSAAALGAIYGGVQFAAWYPITPASSLAETLHEYIPRLRKDPESGKDTCVIVQAEDEIAAIGMATGAGWAGLRSMTSTSGPGFSLMTEYAGLAYFAEIPVVLWDVQRMGPSTGLPTRTAQGDLTMASFLGHGDTHYIILIPATVNECFEFGWKAFDLAEHLQTPVIVLSDLDLGMNQWISPRFAYPAAEMDRGKVLWEGDLDKLNGEWGRYHDVDGDGITYRTVMGNMHPSAAYFTRGTGHDDFAHYSEEPENWELNLTRLKHKLEEAKTIVPAPVVEQDGDVEIGIITMGSAESAVNEARFMMQSAGFKTDYLRVKALPFSPQVFDFVKKHRKNYVVELNQDGQLHQLLTLAITECSSQNLTSIAHSDGLPLTAKWVMEQILKEEEK